MIFDFRKFAMSTFIIACTWTGFVVGAAFGFIIACVVLGSILGTRDAREDTAG